MPCAMRINSSSTSLMPRSVSSQRKGSTLVNTVTLKTLTYSYASAGGTPLVDGVTPARTIGFLFRGSLLVGYQFVSSFRDDHTDFDESRVKDIRKGDHRGASSGDARPASGLREVSDSKGGDTPRPRVHVHPS